MQIANVDTLIAHVLIPNAIRLYTPFIAHMQQIESEFGHEATVTEFGGLEIQYYPERTTSHWHAFKIWIPSESTQAVSIEFRIYDREQKEESKQWPIEVVFRSSTCWSLPFRELWEWTIQILQSLVSTSVPLETILSRVSRIDVAVDTDTLQFQEEDRNRFTSRARYQANYGESQCYSEDFGDIDSEEVSNMVETATYHRGSECTGFVFGKGSLLARIYNKWFEITKSHSYKNDKQFFAGIWKQAGWNIEKDVWRIEFQLRREALHEFKEANTQRTYAEMSVPETVEKIAAIFPYLMLEWLTYRTPTRDKNKAKWPIDPHWKQMVEQFEKYYGISERHPLTPQFNPVHLAKSLKGYLSAYAVAIGESSSLRLFEHLSALLTESLELKDTELFEVLDTQIQTKAKLHGIRLYEPDEN
ncbi:hypothetical protein LLE49_27080 [Alicyclobacillus tolerans]|uniref:hypothetical protein n=1 Tax=Alicyclobacillus tolerans TaxID=90970 RepID=UPI001F452982|nr:hypothetical protein [Alicyclobacillus tolerans]MCF8568386.1 hypothetical protein [Alicyclobacillus tolerans]